MRSTTISILVDGDEDDDVEDSGVDGDSTAFSSASTFESTDKVT